MKHEWKGTDYKRNDYYTPRTTREAFGFGCEIDEELRVVAKDTDRCERKMQQEHKVMVQLLWVGVVGLVIGVLLLWLQ